MSFENAILVHATALENLAAALAALTGTRADLAKVAEIADKAGADTAAVEKATAEIEEMGSKSAAKDAELEQAVQKVEKAATAGKPKAKAETGAEKAKPAEQSDSGAGSSDDAAPALDYAKDVRPVLLAAIKKAGKDQVQALINGFGVDKADKVDPAKYGELLAGAQKLAA